MAGEYLFEAFQELDDLEETTFEVSDDGIKKVEATIEADDDSVEVYDTDANEEDELEGSYIGKVILDCPVCRSKIFRDPEAVITVEDGEVVNAGDECPYCMQADGYKVVGQVSKYEGAEEASEDLGDEDEKEDLDGEKEDLDESASRKRHSAGGSVRKRLEARGMRFDESVGTDVGEYQKWVDYDMKRYGKVSKTTLEKLKKAGLTVVKDKYGDLEVIAHEKIHESVKSVSVETDDTRIEVSPEGDGAINVHAEDLGAAEEGEETIVPVTDETVAEIEGDEGFEEVEETSEESEEEIPGEDEEMDFSDFDEEEIDELGESYLKRVYENVSSYKTTKGAIRGNKLVFEGVITFKSGKKTTTKFVFEAKERTKTGKLRFLGENKALSGNSRAFTLTGRSNGSKLVCESLRYNYRARDAKTGKTTPISGAVHTSKK